MYQSNLIVEVPGGDLECVGVKLQEVQPAGLQPTSHVSIYIFFTSFSNPLKVLATFSAHFNRLSALKTTRQFQKFSNFFRHGFLKFEKNFLFYKHS